MTEAMLTTVDNPYNPFTQFDEWYAFDQGKGYNSCEYLSRIAKTSDELSEEDNDLAIDQAINDIIFFNVLGIYQKVTRENFDEMKSKELTQEQEEALTMLKEANAEETID